MSDDVARLVLQVQAGERDALDELLGRIATPLVRYLRSLTRDDALADDLAQEVMVTIYRKIQFLDDVRAFHAWMYRIATRLANRRLTRRRKEEPFDETCDSIPVEEVAPADPWLLERLPAAVESLGPASQSVIVLHYFNELSISEIADVLEISTGTVKSRLAYGLTKLRNQFM